MECLSCLESLGTRLDCCPDKLICRTCSEQKLEIKCPDCGIVSVPSEDDPVPEYLTGKFRKLLLEIEKRETDYDLIISNQTNYLKESNLLISNQLKLGKSDTLVQVNLKEVELALETNLSIKAQFESMKRVLKLTPSLGLFGAYLKIKKRVKDLPIPFSVNLDPVSQWNTSVLSQERNEWLTVICHSDCIPRYVRINNKQPLRTLYFDKDDHLKSLESTMGLQTAFHTKEIYPGYFLILIEYSNKGVIIWNPQTQKVKFVYKGHYTSCSINAKWFVIVINRCTYFKKLNETGPLIKIEIDSEYTNWSIYRDFLVINISGVVVRISLDDPNERLVISNDITKVLNSTHFIKENRKLVHYDLSTGRLISSIDIPKEEVYRNTDQTAYLKNSRKVAFGGKLYEIPKYLTFELSKFYNLLSTGEFLKVSYENKRFTFLFY